MKTLSSIGLAAFFGSFAFLPGRVLATNVGTGLVSQLAYLGEASQPDRIPLSPAITRSNYGYGTYGLISESRPLCSIFELNIADIRRPSCGGLTAAMIVSI